MGSEAIVPSTCMYEMMTAKTVVPELKGRASENLASEIRSPLSSQIRSNCWPNFDVSVHQKSGVWSLVTAHEIGLPFVVDDLMIGSLLESQRQGCFFCGGHGCLILSCCQSSSFLVTNVRGQVEPAPR